MTMTIFKVMFPHAKKSLLRAWYAGVTLSFDFLADDIENVKECLVLFGGMNSNLMIYVGTIYVPIETRSGSDKFHLLVSTSSKNASQKKTLTNLVISE